MEKYGIYESMIHWSIGFHHLLGEWSETNKFNGARGPAVGLPEMLENLGIPTTNTSPPKKNTPDFFGNWGISDWSI